MSPASVRRSVNSSSSESELGCLDLVFWRGLRRGREEKGDEEEEERERFGGLDDFLMRLEWAAENLKLIFVDSLVL